MPMKLQFQEILRLPGDEVKSVIHFNAHQSSGMLEILHTLSREKSDQGYNELGIKSQRP